jgi:hypothetical protein
MYGEILSILVVLIIIIMIMRPRPHEKFRGRSAYTGVSQDRRVFDYSDRYPNIPEIS